MLKVYGIDGGILSKYEQAAKDTFHDSFVNKEKVLEYADSAGLSDDNKELLAEFMGCADEKLKQFIWLFYYIQFESEEDFIRDIWQLDQIPMPSEVEMQYPGCIKAVTYLLAAEHLREWLRKRELPISMMESYYDRYRYFVSMNLISHGTCGLCRLSPFLYGYARPFILRIGRLAFQFTQYKDYCEMYEDKEGNRVFMALPNYSYNEKGLQDKNGRLPGYECSGEELVAHRFDTQGRLVPKPIRLDMQKFHKILSPGDNVITIHIPEGEKLDINEVKESIREASGLFQKYFPPSKAFVCHTWFIDPGLRGEIIKEGTNMAAFADLFDVISGPDNENHSVFEHVFKVKRQPLEELVPQNDFQRRVLQRALRGEKIYWSYGVLKSRI